LVKKGENITITSNFTEEDILNALLQTYKLEKIEL
jgi:hypothetical protein